MRKTKNSDNINNIIGSYKFGFKTNSKSVVKTNKGLNEDVIKQISKIKCEPDWMLKIRLQAYRYFVSAKDPDWGPDLSGINFNDYTYYIKSTEKISGSWADVPPDIKNTFDKIGIPQAEQKFLAGVTTQFESEAVYHNILKEVEKEGIIFTDTDTALKLYPDLFKKYFSTLVPFTDNKYAALNTAVWSGGTFIYVPKGVKLNKPLQSYFRINSERMGQFERTLIIVEDDSQINYVEGCTAPIYSNNSLHAAVVEIFVGKNSNCRYSTIQNWSNNIINLVTKRAIVDSYGQMEWIDGNIGSGLNMKYPSCILKGEYAMGTTISIAFASGGQNHDTGAKMIHLAPHTSSNIVSKSISRYGGNANYRGLVKILGNAKFSKSHIECDTLILDKNSSGSTFPYNIVNNGQAVIEYEATTGRVSEEQLFYLMSRGLTKAQATEMIVMGFIEPFSRELPMEYAVELNQLMKINMENSIG